MIFIFHTILYFRIQGHIWRASKERSIITFRYIALETQDFVLNRVLR